ncbi:MAG: flippase [Clostridia bacterium]|nr:flippase [Clostridia bacterium]
MGLTSLLKNKTVKNAGWIIGGKIAYMAMSFIVGLLTARYLGPSSYGLISYATAYVTFFHAFCTLGITNILVKKFVDSPDEEGVTIGTTLVLRGISSLLSIGVIVGIVAIVDKGENLTVLVALLCSLGVMFQIFDTINYWFQRRLKSKYSSLASLVGYFVVSAYRVLLLILNASVEFFALATAVDYLVIAVFLIIAYKKNQGPKFSFSIKKAKELLRESSSFILTGMMGAIYAVTDKFMLKQMIGETVVGYYAVAVALSTIWCFVLSAVIDSVVPSIMEAHNKEEELFEKRCVQLYAIVFYLSLFVSLMFTIFSDLAIKILYGKAYLPSSNILKVVTWYTAFSYLGVARNSWMVCKNVQKYSIIIYVTAALANIVGNYFLIPVLGAVGAGLASLITQILTILIAFFIKPLRRNFVLMCKAVILKGVFEKKNQTINTQGEN